MRKNLLLLLCLLLSQLTFAGIVTQDEAQQKAQAFIAKHNKAAQHRGMSLAAKGSELTPAKATANSYYVFNVGQAEGFVVVSGDDRTPAILGYSKDGSFDAANIPANMRAWLQGYADQLSYLESHSNATVAKAPQLDEHLSIYPMLTTTWDQGAPYNGKCPTVSSKTTLTGCVATAMAQVINYHKHPASTIATIPAYKTSTYGLNVSAISPTVIDWSNMLDSYKGNETAAQKGAVANLMLLCGASVQMDYCLSSDGGSGADTYDVSNALETYFDFDESTKYVERGHYRANEWNNLIYNELVNNRPVLYGGLSSGGGHAFVIDGYEKEGYFHVNWGWSGACNNYFLLSILDPESNSGSGASSSSDGYSFYQDAIIGAQPNNGGKEAAVRMTTYALSASKSYITKEDGVFVNSIKAVLLNLTAEEHTFDVGVGIYDNNDNLLHAIAVDNCDNVQLPVNWGWDDFNVELTFPEISDGEYKITLISRESGTDTWHQNANSNKYYLKATVSGNTMRFSNPVVSLNGTIEVNGNMEVGSKLNIKTTIKNNGDFFNDQLFLLVGLSDGNYLYGGRYLEVASGDTDVLEMSYTPSESGSQTIYLCRTVNSDYLPIAQKTITINAPKSYSLSFSNGKVTNATGSNITSTTAKIQVDVKNNSAYDYNQSIITYPFYSQVETGNFHANEVISTPVSIAAGETKTIDIEVKNLTDRYYYWFIMSYYSNGEVVSYNSSSAYTNMPVYRVVVPTAPDADLIAAYNDAKKAASDALNDAEYAAVTGEERTALSNAIAANSNVDNTTEAYNAAISALNKATSTFKAAKEAYESVIALQQMIGTYKYASAEKAAAVEALKDQKPASAADAKAKAEEWMPLLRKYAESSAMLEGVQEHVDWTITLKNANAQNGTEHWSTVNGSGSNATVTVLTGEPLTDGDGNLASSYFDGGKRSADAWDTSFEQEVMLPTGKFQLTVSSRGSADLNSFTLYAGNQKVEMSHTGNTGGLFGNGWNDASLVFELDADTSLKIGVQGTAKSADNWMSFGRFRLVMFDSSLPTGIRQLNSNTDPQTVYSLSGQQVSKARKGLYIIRSGQGKGKKVVVR